MRRRVRHVCLVVWHMRLMRHMWGTVMWKHMRLMDAMVHFMMLVRHVVWHMWIVRKMWAVMGKHMGIVMF